MTYMLECLGKDKRRPNRRPGGSVGASADRLPVVHRIPACPLGSLECDPLKGNGRRPQKKDKRRSKQSALPSSRTKLRAWQEDVHFLQTAASRVGAGWKFQETVIREDCGGPQRQQHLGLFQEKVSNSQLTNGGNTVVKKQPLGCWHAMRTCDGSNLQALEVIKPNTKNVIPMLCQNKTHHEQKSVPMICQNKNQIHI